MGGRENKEEEASKVVWELCGVRSRGPNPLPRAPLLPPSPRGLGLPYKARGTQLEEARDSERDPS